MDCSKLVGMQLRQAKSLLDEANCLYTVEVFADRKLQQYDKEIVARATINMGQYHLVVCPIQFEVVQHNE